MSKVTVSGGGSVTVHGARHHHHHHHLHLDVRGMIEAIERQLARVTGGFGEAIDFRKLR